MSSRHFERSFTTDQLTLAAGDLATVDGGPITLGIVFRLDDVSPFQLLVQARTSGLAEVWAIGVDGGTLFFATSAGFRDGPTVSANTWYQYVATKAGGSAVVRDHLRNLSTGSWTHSDRGSALGDGSGTVDTVRVSDGSSARIDGYIAALGCGGFTPANDAAVEAYSGLSAWISAGMAAVLRMSDTPVNDLVGSTDQSALSGTTVESEDPGSNFTLTTGSTVTGTATGTVGGLTGAATGTRTVLATAAGTVGGLSGSAAGVRTVHGTAAGTVGGISGSAAGVRTVAGVAAGTVGGLAGAATGLRTVPGAASGGVGGVTGAAVGVRTVRGTGTGVVGGIAGAAVVTGVIEPGTLTPSLSGPTLTPSRSGSLTASISGPTLTPS